MIDCRQAELPTRGCSYGICQSLKMSVSFAPRLPCTAGRPLLPLTPPCLPLVASFWIFQTQTPFSPLYRMLCFFTHRLGNPKMLFSSDMAKNRHQPSHPRTKTTMQPPPLLSSTIKRLLTDMTADTRRSNRYNERRHASCIICGAVRSNPFPPSAGHSSQPALCHSEYNPPPQSHVKSSIGDSCQI